MVGFSGSCLEFPASYPSCMGIPIFSKGCILLAVVLVFLPEAMAFSKPELERQALGALSKLYSRNRAAAELGRNSVAVLVFPDAHMVGLGLAVQSGSGVLFYRNNPAAFFNLTGASMGLELGIQKFDYAIFFDDNEALEKLYQVGGFQIGVAPTLVLGDGIFAGKLSTSSVRTGVHPFVSGQTGLLFSLGLGKLKLTEYIPGD
jgi:lipid-binding SYLF domain-containing protein